MQRRPTRGRSRRNRGSQARFGFGHRGPRCADRRQYRLTWAATLLPDPGRVVAGARSGRRPGAGAGAAVRASSPHAASRPVGAVHVPRRRATLPGHAIPSVHARLLHARHRSACSARTATLAAGERHGVRRRGGAARRGPRHAAATARTHRATHRRVHRRLRHAPARTRAARVRAARRARPTGRTRASGRRTRLQHQGDHHRRNHASTIVEPIITALPAAIFQRKGACPRTGSRRPHERWQQARVTLQRRGGSRCGSQIALVPFAGRKRECGEGLRLQSAAVPATVSGERRARAFL